MYKLAILKIGASRGKFLALCLSIGVLAFTGHVTPSVFAATSNNEVLVDLVKSRPNWKLETADGLVLILERLEPDMARTFMLGRGFNIDAANLYAGTCVYKTVLENASTKGELEVDLKEWRVIIDGKPKHFVIEPDWQKRWDKLAVSPSAKIAFKWTQFQAKQTHGPGDWLQGMSNMDLAPDTRFDLKITWKKGNKLNQSVLKNIRCGPPEKK